MMVIEMMVIDKIEPERLSDKNYISFKLNLF